MLQAAADILMQSRQRLAETLSDLTQEQWFKQPEGFANNIAWNVGHLIIAQQQLCYGRLGIDGYADPSWRSMYGGGTSPADWKTQPDTAELLGLLVEFPKRLPDDIKSGKFDSYVKPEGKEERFPAPLTVAHAFIFNQSHEGMHMGNIGDLRAFI